MDSLRSDLQYGVRQLLRTPGITFLAVLTLALGIGANTALYTLATTILNRPRPGVGDSKSLVWVSATTPARSRPMSVSYQVADMVRREVPLIEMLATVREVPLALGTRGEPARVSGEAVSHQYFPMLRAPFALGRPFLPEEDANGGQPVVVLSHHAWQTWFEGDRDIIGRGVAVNGMQFTIVGVTAPGFNGAVLDEVVRDAWIPATMLATVIPSWAFMVNDPTGTNIRALARLRSPGDAPQVNAALKTVASRIAAADTSRGEGWTLRLDDASAGLPAGARTQIAPLAALAVVVTGLLLLICCANVSNIMLARGVARQREVATRLALGASRRRVVRQLLTESVVLALAAAVAALFVATWGMELLLARALPLPLDISFDLRVFLVCAGLALTTGVAFGLAPALHASRRGAGEVLRGAATGGDRGRSRLQSGFVIAQVALSLLLLSLSGLFLRSLDKAQRIDVGFEASSSVLVTSIDPGLQRYDATRSTALAQALLERSASLPGVEQVALSDIVPLSEWSSVIVKTQIATGSPESDELRASLSHVTPGYLSVIRQPLVMGRNFTDADREGAEPVAIVTEGFAKRAFGERSPIGARVFLGFREQTWHTIVGVASDAIVQSLAAPPVDGLYVPMTFHSPGPMALMVRTRGGDASLLSASVRDIVRDLDAQMPVHRQRTMAQVREAATEDQRRGAMVLAVFGALALLLAAVGLHGVLWFTVRQRTREVGIRMALGASRHVVTRLIVGSGLRLTLIGGALGIVLALGATPLMRSMLFGIEPNDWLTFALVSLLFLAVAAFASWLPARGASRIDPMTAIRSE